MDDILKNNLDGMFGYLMEVISSIITLTHLGLDIMTQGCISIR